MNLTPTKESLAVANSMQSMPKPLPGATDDTPMENIPGDHVIEKIFNSSASGNIKYKIGFHMKNFTREAHVDTQSKNSQKRMMVDMFEYYVTEGETVRGSINGVFRPHPQDWYAFENGLHMSEGAFDQCAIWYMIKPYYERWLKEMQLSDTALTIRDYFNDRKAKNEPTELDDINVNHLESCGYLTVYQASQIKPWEHRSKQENPEAIILNGDPDLLEKVVDEFDDYIVKMQKAERERLSSADQDPARKELTDAKLRIAALETQLKNRPVIEVKSEPEAPLLPEPDVPDIDPDEFLNLSIKEVDTKESNNPTVTSLQPNTTPVS